MPVSDAASRRSYLDTSEKVPKVNAESCCSVSHLCPTLCNSMNCSTPGFPVLHYLQEFAQTHVHWVCDTIQLSHPMLSPSPLAFNLSQILIFFNESSFIIRWPKYWSFNLSISPSNEYSEFISFRIDWLVVLAVQSALQSLLQHHSSKASSLWHSEFSIVQFSYPCCCCC